MSLPESAKAVLRNNIDFCWNDKFEVTNEDIVWFKDNLGITKQDSAFIDFYSIVTFPPIGNGDELYSLDSILEVRESGYHEEENPGIYDRFLAISSIEGEGSYFYEVSTDMVYDTNWGEEESMMNGTLKKNWPSFFAFLDGYYDS